MNCERIKDLIKTDYIDNEINQALKKEVKRHLDACADCRQFEKTLRQAVIEPFKKEEKVQPPEFLWSRIKERIEREQEEQKGEGFFVGLKNKLEAIFSIPKPAFALATIMVIILMVAVFRRLPLYPPSSRNYVGTSADVAKRQNISLLADNPEEYVEIIKENFGISYESGIHNQGELSDYIGEQVEFLSYLDVQDADYLDTDYVDLGTAIEKYFL